MKKRIWFSLILLFLLTGGVVFYVNKMQRRRCHNKIKKVQRDLVVALHDKQALQAEVQALRQVEVLEDDDVYVGKDSKTVMVKVDSNILFDNFTDKKRVVAIQEIVKNTHEQCDIKNKADVDLDLQYIESSNSGVNIMYQDETGELVVVRESIDTPSLVFDKHEKERAVVVVSEVKGEGGALVQNAQIPIIGQSIETECKSSMLKKIDFLEHCGIKDGDSRFGVVFLRDLYNHALVEDYDKNKWIVNASFHSDFEYNGFNDCGQETSLARLLFGKFRIMDIFLLSKLSFDGKLYFDSSIPVDSEILNQAGRNRRVDQYLSYLAPFNVEIEADRREKRVDFGALYRFYFGRDDRVACSLGCNIPVKSVSQIMDLSLVGADLRNYGFASENINFVLKDFHQSFIDVLDFFRRVILDPKKLCFNERQHKIGVGDISLFALFDLNNLFDSIDGFQIGVDVVFPSGNKYEGHDVWEVILGNGGAFQLGFSANWLLKTSRKYFNPSWALGGTFSFDFESCRRVPKLKFNNEEGEILAEDVKNLIVPVFNSHRVSQFAEYDSCVSDFSDQAVTTNTKLGGIFLFSLGNYFYHVFHENFRLSFFYDFLYKGRDNVFVCDKGIYDTCALERCTDMRSHQISWTLAYVSRDAGVEAHIGSKHVLGGVNATKTNSIYASFIANF